MHLYNIKYLFFNTNFTTVEPNQAILFLVMICLTVAGWNNSSLSFGRTSAGIVCCFWGMFDTILEPHKIKCIVAFLSQNLVHHEYVKYIKKNAVLVKWINLVHQKFHHKIQCSCNMNRKIKYICTLYSKYQCIENTIT